MSALPADERQVLVRASAKINLHLGVGAPRPDGFHPLVTVFQAISLYDDVVARHGDAVRVEAAAYIDVSTVPLDHTNIAMRAIEALGRRHDRRLGADLAIRKEIPVAGGMAGGSADAAAALVAADRLWDLGSDDETLLGAAADVGSDVPFALVGGTAIGTGRGELIVPVADEATWSWVVVPSREGHLSTPEVYRHWDELHPDASSEPAPADLVLKALASGSAATLAAALHNDLQAATLDLRPDLGDLIELGEAEGALRGMVSGSGPSCVFLCESGEHARAVAGGLLGAGHDTVLTAYGPAPGAHVVEQP
jgi:4-diphosphocytidyl-2-C-methyl-D-erythritol kinase